MSPDRWIATAADLALIAFIVWFFWLKSTTGFRASETTGGYPRKGAIRRHYHRSERPAVRLNFRREETASCSDKVIFAVEECRAPYRADCRRGVAA